VPGFFAWCWIGAGCAAEPEVLVGGAQPAAQAPPSVEAAPRAAPAAGRIVAAGDLHGDLDNAIAALSLAGVVDAEGRWTGGQTTLVQTGDVTDRGPDSRAIMAWLRGLRAEARAAGGDVVALLGNHEIMNLRGDWRYVHPGDLAAYGGEAPRRAALGPQGEDGRWLRSLDVAARVGDTVFVHGGVHPDFAAGGVEALSTRARASLDAPGAPEVLVGETSPTWFRGYVTEPEAAACPLLARALDQLGAARMVVGHTTRRDGRVEARCGGALLVIDVGIADGYGGNLAVIEIRPGSDAWAAYPAGPVDLPDPR
jgi:hypothetical protein